MPEILLPLSLIHFFGVSVVVSPCPMAQIVFERSHILISIGVVHGALQWCRWVEVVALEALAAWQEERLLHGLI